MDVCHLLDHAGRYIIIIINNLAHSHTHTLHVISIQDVNLCFVVFFLLNGTYGLQRGLHIEGGPKTGHKKSITVVYNDIGKRSIY